MGNIQSSTQAFQLVISLSLPTESSPYKTQTFQQGQGLPLRQLHNDIQFEHLATRLPIKMRDFGLSTSVRFIKRQLKSMFLRALMVCL